MKQFTFIASLMTMLAAPLFSQNDSSTVLRNPLDNLIVRSVVKQSIFPEERVYLHFDNNAYYLGETMWFKAYVTSGTDDTPTTMSRVSGTRRICGKDQQIQNRRCRLLPRRI